MGLNELTRPAVLQAVEEFNRLGRDNFLQQHGYGKALSYFLIHDGQRYDLKAIAGVAHGYIDDGSRPLQNSEFSGGEAQVASVLRRLGFEVENAREGASSDEASGAAMPRAPGSATFAELLRQFFAEFAAQRSGPFGIAEELADTTRALEGWLRAAPPVARRATIKVKMSVGQGNWAKIPWIALLDTRVTSTTQKGIYAVFLFSEDLSITYLNLAQGITELVNRLGQRAAVEEMQRVAESVRPHISELASEGFQLDNEIDLRSGANAARNYKAGTIAHVDLPTEGFPDDEPLDAYLEALLSAYDKIVAEGVPGPRSDQEADAEVLAALPYSVDDAMAELFIAQEQFERCLDIWRAKKNLILQGAPGVGKSFIARRLAYALIEARDDSKIEAVQFHQSYSYEDFVQGYRPDGSGGFELQDGTFRRFCDAAISDPETSHVFLIDEINRGNLSKILGELMLLIEADKRGPEWATRLAYARPAEPPFFIPENVYILGMMNTADRSLSMVDYALRRRFAFVTLEPMFGSQKFREHLAARGIPAGTIDRVVARMAELNEEVASDKVNLGPGFRIGHSFFTPTSAVDDPEAWYRRIVETEIHPLLEEYWFDDPAKADQWRDQLLAGTS